IFDIDVTAFLPAAGHVVDTSLFHRHIRPRRHNSHKGDFGDAGIIGGASGMVGADLLAGRAALRLGAGRVFVSLLDELAPRVDTLMPELMLRTADCVLNQASALAIGPGLGQSPKARETFIR
ncbi:NAD(P)H-hydrate dehydratase, partial [Arthrospira platensis SPKY1]|nr:NAD(P)H-hydrate dehydratase [Arthrospira platensis SPKY1]